jgi:Protein of unknown function (DUF998)
MPTVERPTRRTPSARRAEPGPSAGRAKGRRFAIDAILVGLTGFVAAAGTADLANPDWSPVESMVSHYVHARAGWLITVALLSLAAASAVLLRLAASRTRGGRLGLWLLGVWTAGVLLGAVFPTDPYGQWDQPPTPAGMVHGIAGLIAFVVLPAAAVVLTRTWRRDRRWRPVARPLTVAAALTVTTFLALMIAFFDVQGGPSLSVGPWERLIGLAERLMLWSCVAWLAVATVGARRRIFDEEADDEVGRGSAGIDVRHRRDEVGPHRGAVGEFQQQVVAEPRVAVDAGVSSGSPGGTSTTRHKRTRSVARAVFVAEAGAVARTVDVLSLCR